jgi:hypothetical protein
MFLAVVVEKVRPHRLDGHGEAWRLLEQHQEQIMVWLEVEDLTVVKVRELLGRQGVVVPARTLERFAAGLCGPRRGRGSTVRVADGEPGDELQVDFGRMGLLFDPETDRRRVCHALIFTACCSRHCFVWLTFPQTTAAVIEGFEAAWRFFGGVFRTGLGPQRGSVDRWPAAAGPDRACGWRTRADRPAWGWSSSRRRPRP